MITRVTGKNQVTIPAELVSREGIAPGSRLVWESTEEPHVLRVRILPNEATLAASLRGRGRGRRRSNADPVETLVREREEDADRR